MNLLVILTVFINYMCINGAPVSHLSVYDVIKQTASDPKLNCTEVRSSPLLEPQSQFLTNCMFNDIKNVSENESNFNNDLCLLYYSNVMNLCRASTNQPQLNIMDKLHNDVINEQIAVVCGTIINETASSVYNDVKDAVGSLLKKFDYNYCASMCLMPNLYVKPECILNAFMLKTVRSLNLIDNTKSLKPLHTVKETPETHQEAHELTINKNAEIDDNALSGLQLNQKIKSKDATGTNNTVEVTVVSPVQTETKAQQSDDQPSLNLDVKSSTLNQFDSGISKVPETIQAVEGNAAAVETTVQLVNKVNEKKQSDTAPNTDINKQPAKTSLDGQEEVKTITDGKSGEKSGSNLQHLKLEKTSTTKLNEPIKTEESNQDDFMIDKQVTNNNNDVAVSEKNQVVNNMEKEDLGGDGDDIGAGINEAEDYQESPLDNPGVPEVSLGNPTAAVNEKPKSSEVKTKITEELGNKPHETNEDDDGIPANFQNQSIDDSDSYFFSYFMMVCIMFICGYVAYHNKQKILALVVEGRKGRRTSRTRRPNSANYRKLDSNLEEAVTSSCNKNTTQIIY